MGNVAVVEDVRTGLDTDVVDAAPGVAITATDATSLPADLLVKDLGDGLTLRLADPSEYVAVGETLYEAFKTNGPMSEFYKHRLLDIPDRAKAEDIWVIVDGDGTLYGACTTVKPAFNREPTFEFNTMGVLPIGRGHGLGRAFVEHSIAVGKAYGYRKVLIHSGPNMPYAHRLYQRCGFVRHRELETLVVDGGQRLLVFTYDID